MWISELKLFMVLNSTGKHWHTIGFPVEGKIHVLVEEAFFLVEMEQAVFTLQEEGINHTNTEVLQDLVQREKLMSLHQLEAYLTLKRLGYVLFRPDCPYLKDFDDLDSNSDYVVFKPNSSFQKKNPTGFLGCLHCRNAESPFCMN